jgi:hypothetical protein
VAERVKHAERRLGFDRRTSPDRREADADCLAARILQSIDQDRRSGKERRRGVERRMFEKVRLRLRRR